MVRLLCSLPYVVRYKKIINNQQKVVTYNYSLSLFENKIESYNQVFPIEEVLDMSAKKLNGMEWILYLHTTNGMFTFYVSKNPTLLLNHFHQIKLKKGD